MALINHVKREINAKLVYFGPARAGKATNLNVIFKKLKPECRGKLKSMAVQSDRMLFFDFTPPGRGNVDGYRVRFHVYTLAGNVASASAWKTVLKGVDGVVFVADSTPNQQAANQESLASLREQLQGYGKQLEQVPCIVQFNKRDLSGALPLDELRQMFAAGGFPSIPAIARKGEGVVDTLSRLAQMVMNGLSESGLELEQGPEHVAALEEGAPSPESSSRIVKEESGAACTVAAEMTSEPGPTVSPAAGMDAPTIEMGEPVAVSGGGLRLPLVVRCGGKEKKVVVSLSLSLESAETE